MPENAKKVELIKKKVINRMRRHNKAAARRLRLLPSHLFSKLVDHAPASSPSPFEHERAAMVTLAKTFNDKYTAASRVISGDVPDTLKELKQKLLDDMAAHQRMANALLMGDDESSTALSVQHFLSSNNDSHANNQMDALPLLARKLASLSQQHLLNGKGEQSVVRRIKLCLSESNKALDKFYSMLRESHETSIFSEPGSSLISVPDDWATFFTFDTLKEAFNVGSDEPTSVISNNFKEGGSSVLYSSQEPITTKTKSGLSFELSEQCLKLNGHADYDELLNNIKGSPHHPLREVNTALSGQPVPTPENPIMIGLDDLSTVNALNIECRTASKASSSIQMDFFMALQRDMVGVFLVDNTRRLMPFHELPHNSNVTYIVDEANGISLNILATQISALKATSLPLTFKLTQQAPGNFSFSHMLSAQSQELLTNTAQVHEIPHPHKEALTRSVRQSATPLRENGYLSKQFSPRDWGELLSQVGDGHELLDKGAKALNLALNASSTTTFIDLQFERESDARALPYRITASIYSLTQKGPNVRSIEVLIKNENNLSTATLQALGLSMEEFTELALEPAQAEKILAKPFSALSAQKRVLCGIRNSKMHLNIIKETMPALFDELNAHLIVDPLSISKRNTLSSRSDDIMPIYLERHGGKPVYFADTPGSDIGVRGLLSGSTKRILSTDEKYGMSLDGDNVIIHDFFAGAKLEWGGKVELSLHLHATQNKPNVQHSEGSLEALLKESKVSHILRSSAPKSAPSLVEFIMPQALIDELSPKGKERFLALSELWLSVQNSYDFSISIYDNQERLAPLLNENSVPLDAIIAGGTGGQKGKLFLKELYKKSSALFWAATSGKGINTHVLLTRDNAAQPLSAKDASLTVADVLRANMIAFQVKNPDLVNHFQMNHLAGSILSRLEPNTARPPSEIIDKIAAEYGCPSGLVRALYKSAYEDKAKRSSNGHFEDFLPRESSLSIGKEGRLLSGWVFWELLSKRIPHSLNITLKKHLIEQAAKLHMMGLHRHIPKNAVHITSSFIIDKSLTCEVRSLDGKPVSPSPQLDIDSIAQIMHLQNGVSHIIASNENSVEANEAESIFISKLKSPRNLALLDEANRYLVANELTAHFIPNDASLQRYGEAFLLAALDGNSTPPFNRHFSEIEIASVLQKAKDGIMKLDEHCLVDSPSQAYHRLNVFADQANMQHRISSLLMEMARGEKVIMFSDDGPSLNAQHIRRLKDSNVPYEAVTTNQAIQMLIDKVGDLLDTRTYAELSHFVKSDELPPQGSTAKRYYQEMLNAYRMPPNLISMEGPLEALARSFQVKCSSPLENVMESESHAKIINSSDFNQRNLNSPHQKNIRINTNNLS